jgi:hypothetical protein
MTERSNDNSSPARRLERLASERTALFASGALNAGRTAEAQARLSAIERELDEAYIALRSQRAVRDAERFTNEERRLRKALVPIETTPKGKPTR